MFLISILFVLISSYLILSVIDKRYKFKNNLGFIFFIIIAFSQIILSFEILSLFKLIARNNFLIMNVIFFICALVLYFKNSKHTYIPQIKEEFQKIKKALKRDKILTFIAFCFVIFFIFRLFYATFFPVVFGDALQYYLPRCTAWLYNGTISHYMTFDAREIIMPVNSELTYLWIMLFTKNEIGCGVFPFIFFVNAIYVIYNFLGELGFCRRKRLWSVFVFSSFSLVFIECVIPGADLWVGSLILTCFYLFYCACKYNKTFLVYTSALVYALAAGVKTTALIAIPASAFVLFMIALIYAKNSTKNKILYFIGFFILNFLIFSSYNYVLNYIDFKNPVSNETQLLLNAFRGGIKGYCYNLIKYFFAWFDFSGMPNILNIGSHIQSMQDKMINILNIDQGIHQSQFFDYKFPFNSNIKIMDSLLGITGLLTFYPAIFYSLYIAIKTKLSKKRMLLCVLALFYIFNILIFSRVMIFTRYNMRYLLAFIVPVSLIIVYTYPKRINLYKIIMTWFLFVLLAFNSHTKPVTFLVQYFNYKSLPIKQQTSHKNFILNNADELEIFKYFYQQKDKKKIGTILAFGRDSSIYYIYKLRLYGHDVQTILPEIITTYNLKDFDYIVSIEDFADSTIIKNNKENAIPMNKSLCFYEDHNGYIYAKNKTRAIAVGCKIPFDYFKENGFNKIDDIKLSRYVILKNTQK